MIRPNTNTRPDVPPDCFASNASPLHAMPYSDGICVASSSSVLITWPDA
ncbi:hypothetical protein LMG24235_08728 [Paraburkholderia sabiae]|nr:hypothetical protein LMG24235_08728 [Paraburkholderia sabiae]